MKEERDWVDKYFFLLEKIFTGYKNTLKKPVGVIVSAGIDSSIIAVLVRRFFPAARFLSLVSEKSLDRPYLPILEKFLSRKIDLVEFDENKVKAILPEVKKSLAGQIEETPVHLSLACGFYLLCEWANRLGIKYLFTGQGPDILFAGYHKYKNLHSSIKDEIVKDLPLLEVDKKRDRSMALAWGIKLINPYLEKEFVDFALSVPQQLLIYRGKEKYISRLLGKRLHLPKAIVNRPKKAMQYSTGLSKIKQNTEFGV